MVFEGRYQAWIETKETDNAFDNDTCANFSLLASTYDKAGCWRMHDLQLPFRATLDVLEQSKNVVMTWKITHIPMIYAWDYGSLLA